MAIEVRVERFNNTSNDVSPTITDKALAVLRSQRDLCARLDEVLARVVPTQPVPPSAPGQPEPTISHAVHALNTTGNLQQDMNRILDEILANL